MRSLAVLCLGMTGCFFGWGNSDDLAGDDVPEAPTPAVVIAVGASVMPILEYGGICDYPRFNHLCLEANPMDITNVTVDSDAFEVGLPIEPDHDLVLPIKALRAGDAILRFELSNVVRSEYVEVLIRAKEIERTDLSVSCTDFSRSDGSEPLGITAGVQVRFEAIAMAGEDQLLTGDLELVQAPGFTLTPPSDDGRVATAPTTTGSYEWAFTGGSSAQFLVYDFPELEPVMNRNPQNGAILVEGRVGNNVKVCIHGRKERAMVEVASGSCRPSFSYAEVVGPMPIGLGGDPPFFGFAGNTPFALVSDVAESCTLTARVESTGHMTTATFDAEPAEVTPLPSGTAITTTPITIAPVLTTGSDCGGSLTDGDCDGHLEYPPVPVDGDCYIDSDWEYQFLDGTAIGDNEFVGVGLVTEVRLKVVAKILGLLPFDVGPPQDLELSYAADELQIESRGCTSGEEVLSVTALQSASILGHSLGFSASNLDDTEDFRIRAKDVGSVRFGDRTGGATYWEHSLAPTAPTYFNGSSQLRGRAAMTIESTTGSAVLAGTSVSGNAGDTVTMRSMGFSQGVYFVDESNITAIVNFAFNEIGNLGTTLCTNPTPSTGSGPILGNDGPKPRLSLTGGAFTMGSGLQGKLCLFGYAAGASNVTLTWGTHTETRNWRVTDPFGN